MGNAKPNHHGSKQIWSFSFGPTFNCWFVEWSCTNFKLGLNVYSLFNISWVLEVIESKTCRAPSYFSKKIGSLNQI
jgi:hypothetical protein